MDPEHLCRIHVYPSARVLFYKQLCSILNRLSLWVNQLIWHAVVGLNQDEPVDVLVRTVRTGPECWLLLFLVWRSWSMWYRRCPGLVPGPRGWKFKHRKRVPGHSGLRARAPEISMHILCFFCFCFGTGPVRTVHLFFVRNILFFKNRDPVTRNRPGPGRGPAEKSEPFVFGQNGPGPDGPPPNGANPPENYKNGRNLTKTTRNHKID